MPFTWVQNISVNSSVDAVDLNEISTNVSSLYTTLSLTYPGCVSGAGWVDVPVAAGEALWGYKTSVTKEIQEIRTRIDHAYDLNCTTVHSANNSGEHSIDRVSEDTHNGTYHGTHDVGYKSTHQSGHLNAYQNEEKNIEYSTDHTGNYSTNNGTNHGSYYNSYDFDHHGSEDHTYDSAQQGTVNGTKYTSATLG